MAWPTGPSVVLTREPDDNRELAAALAARSIPVREIPCLAVRLVEPHPVPDGPFDALVFTSRRGVAGLLAASWARTLLSPDGRHRAKTAPRRPVVAAVGQATASELKRRSWAVDLVADPPEGGVLARLLATSLARGARIALPRGNLRAGALDATLAEAGYTLAPIVVYENTAPDIPRLDPFAVAAVFVASPSAARRLLAGNPWMASCPFLAIGDTTAAALRDLGVDRAARTGSDFDDWVEQLCLAYRRATARWEP